VRAIQRTQIRAKNTKNDLNPTYLVKRNFCFETEGVYGKGEGQLYLSGTWLDVNMKTSTKNTYV
jgi:hypothetical protein